jgi:hypothetical protein
MMGGGRKSEEQEKHHIEIQLTISQFLKEAGAIPA